MFGHTNTATYIAQALDARKAHSIALTSYQYDQSTNPGRIVIDGTSIATVAGRGTDIFKLSRQDLHLISQTHEDTYSATGCSNTIANLANATENEIVIMLSMDATSQNSTVNSYLNQMGGSVSATWSAARLAQLFIGIRGLAQGKGYYTYCGGGSIASWGSILLPNESLGITNYNGDYVALDTNNNLVKYNGTYNFFGY